MGRYLEKGAFFPDADNMGEYRIAEMIGKGSSCAVYLADFTDHEGNVTEHILKEYNPATLHAARSSDGRLTVEEAERAEFENDLLRFRTGYQRQLAIRRMCELKNSTINVQKIFEANGTSYIDMTVFSGTVYSRVKEESLYLLLKRMKALMQVIGSYHKAGFLHLDIKPDNIFVIPETCELVMLFDFDSVMERSKVCLTGVLSCTRDWAAPEQTAPALRRQICEATDLYAVGEILFFKIFDRHSSPEERRPFAEYGFDTEAPIFKDVNPKIFPLLTDFLHHTIRASVKGRYQSAGELLKDLDRMIKLADPKEPYLMSSACVPQSFFIGRDHELARIHEILQDNDIVFISGIGGIGKSELAKNYAKTYRSDYDNIIFTTYHGSLQALINDDAKVHIANFRQYQGESEPDYFRRKLRKLKELCDHRVLFILDNFDDAELGSEAQECLKNILGMGCRFIITTRIREWSYVVYDVNVFSEQEDLVRLFLEYCPINDGEMPAVLEIIDYVDGHTLTVELIARQTKAGFSTPTQMLAKLKEYGLSGSGKEKIHSAKDDLYGKNTAIDHISAVFDIANLDEPERYVLVNMALMPPDGVRGELFRDWCELEDFDAVNTLITGGWLDRDGNLIKMHPVIGEVAVRCIDEAESQCEKLLWNVKGTIENYEKETKKDKLKSDCAFLNSLAGHILKFGFASELVVEVLDQITNIIADLGYMQETVKYRIRVVDIVDLLFGDEGSTFANALNNLGVLYSAAGNIKRAEECLFRSYEIRKKLYGDKHPDIAGSLNNLGALYYTVGDIEKAEEYFQKSYEIRCKLYGNESPDIANSLNNLGFLYKDVGDLKKAKECLFRSYEIRKKMYEDDHPYIADSLNALGSLYYAAGDLKEAEKFYIKSYKIRQRLYESEYPDIASSLHNLGVLYTAEGDLQKAEECLFQSYGIYQKLYGGNHPEIALSLNSLGSVYYTAGDIEKAENYILKSYVIYQELYGNEHPDTANALRNLGVLYTTAGDLKKAKECLFSAYEILQMLYGDAHPDIALSLNSLGSVYYTAGDIEKAENYFMKSYEVSRKMYGGAHSNTVDVLKNLGILYKKKGDFRSAKKYFNKVLSIYRELYDENHPEIITLERILRKLTDASP